MRILQNNFQSTKYRTLIGIFLVCLFLLVGCSSSDSEGLDIGHDAPVFSAQSAEGSTISISDFKGKQPVLLFFHMAVG